MVFMNIRSPVSAKPQKDVDFIKIGSAMSSKIKKDQIPLVLYDFLRGFSLQLVILHVDNS